MLLISLRCKSFPSSWPCRLQRGLYEIRMSHAKKVVKDSCWVKRTGSPRAALGTLWEHRDLEALLCKSEEALGRDRREASPMEKQGVLPLGPTLAYAIPVLPVLSGHSGHQDKEANAVPTPACSFAWGAGEGCNAYSHAVNDLDEDAAVLELQQGLHRVSHMQTIHLGDKRKSPLKLS